MPEEYFDFYFDPKTLISIVKPLNKRGEKSELIYGLNKYELLRNRNEFVRKLVCIAQFYHSDLEAKNILDEAIKDKSEYAAFARMVKAKYT